MKTLNFVDGELSGFKAIDGVEALAQRVKAYLNFWADDYFLDFDGFNYITEYSNVEAQKRKFIDGCLKTFRGEVTGIKDSSFIFENGRLDVTLNFKTIYGGDLIVGNQ